MLAIEVVFLTGRYVATAYNTRTEAEWPPHPARLFSTLVATHFAADPTLTAGHAEEHALLAWLECQGPPAIRATGASPREVVTVFVPVNDVALTNLDEEAGVVAHARAAVAAAEAAAEPKAIKAAGKVLKTAEAAYVKALARATQVPARGLPGKAKYGARVLPDQRVRQPRTFPSVTPEQPVVCFLWPNAQPTDAQRTSLSALLARVVRLGHSSSLVSVRLVETSGDPTWVPSSVGPMTLRVIEAGQLASLERAFGRHREEEPRVMPSRPQFYARSSGTLVTAPAMSIFGTDWLVLRRVGGPHLPMTAAAGVARQIRRTLMSFTDPVPEILSGHTADRSPLQGPHLAVVPLPFVAHAQASGLILGVALVLPRSASDQDRKAIYRALSEWEGQSRQEDEDVPTVPLHLGAAGELNLERVEWGVVASTLTPEAWCRPSRVWSSVTPMALDQNPGDLRSREPRKLAAATAEAAETVVAACGRVGLPRPVAVEVLPAAPWAGAAKVRQYPRYPETEERTQRVLTHVRVLFAEPVCGPVLLGAGRYTGLGLFRPEAD